MELKAVRAAPEGYRTGALVVALFEGDKRPAGAAAAVDAALGGQITQLIAAGELTGRPNQVVVLHTAGRLPAERVIVVGLGKRPEFGADAVRQAAAAAARAARRHNVAAVAAAALGAGEGGLDAAAAAGATAEGALLGLYTFDRYRTAAKARHLADEEEQERERPHVHEVAVLDAGASSFAAVAASVERARILAGAANHARDLVNTPGNDLTPTGLAEEAKKVGAERGIAVEVLDRAAMERLGMGAALAVGRGSAEPPYFIVMRYRGRPESDALDAAFVGKGLTFDSGGLDLKPASSMEHMYSDMAGAAAVICALEAAAQLKARANVAALVAAVESMPSGHAVRPGDIVRAVNGKTIEVNDTDAEGRLTLADAVAYAKKLGAPRIVDIATLTGAVFTALGRHYSGVVANDQALARLLLAAAGRAGEPMWEFPTSPDYRDQLSSDVADIKNFASGGGGAITAGMFIGEFAGGTPWAHIDIAATGWLASRHGYHPRGGTGCGTRTLAVLAEMLGEGV